MRKICIQSRGKRERNWSRGCRPHYNGSQLSLLYKPKLHQIIVFDFIRRDQDTHTQLKFPTRASFTHVQLYIVIKVLRVVEALKYIHMFPIIHI